MRVEATHQPEGQKFRKAFWFALIVAYVAAGLASAVILRPNSASPSRAFGGGLLTVIAAAPIGALGGLLLSLRKSAHDYASRFMEAVFMALLGASLVSLQKIYALAAKSLPIVAEQLSLNPSVLVLLSTMLSIPTAVLVYLIAGTKWKPILDFFNDLLLARRRAAETDRIVRAFSGEPSGPDSPPLEGSSDTAGAIDQAIRLFQAGSFQEAYSVLGNNSFDGIEEDRRVFALAAVEAKLGKNEDALASLSKIANKKNFEPELQKQLGQCYKALRRFQDAYTEFSNYLSMRPSDKAAILDQLETIHLALKSSRSNQRKMWMVRAQSLVQQVVSSSVITRREVEEIWPDLKMDDSKEE